MSEKIKRIRLSFLHSHDLYQLESIYGKCVVLYIFLCFLQKYFGLQEKTINRDINSLFCIDLHFENSDKTLLINVSKFVWDLSTQWNFRLFLITQSSEWFGLIFCLFLHQEDYWTDQNKYSLFLSTLQFPSLGKSWFQIYGQWAAGVRISFHLDNIPSSSLQNIWANTKKNGNLSSWAAAGW